MCRADSRRKVKLWSRGQSDRPPPLALFYVSLETGTLQERRLPYRILGRLVGF